MGNDCSGSAYIIALAAASAAFSVDNPSPALPPALPCLPSPLLQPKPTGISSIMVLYALQNSW